RPWIDRYATDILGVSRWVLETTWGSQWTDDPRCRVVYDALAPRAFEGRPDRRGVCQEFGLSKSSPLLVHVGRMAEPKNHVRLVSIFAEVLRHKPEARLLLIGRTDAYRGDHAIERRVRARMAELGIVDQIVFAGERNDVPRLLKAADLLLFPSLWEGLGDVVLESRAAGTPVLACDLPCVLEIGDRLPGVHCLSLEETDAKWAESAVRLTNLRPSDRERRTALEFFRQSEFTVERCLDTLCRIWHGNASAPLSGGAADG
ncbi:MAG TPA: glycosyltransferase, partial [Thermoguttaceae bacterium]|nr:glycosyltransferase [Thermoguttaceae bacterium]